MYVCSYCYARICSYCSGDMLCLMGSALYGCSNVLQEYMVKYHDRDEYMGMLGCCGAAISFVQLMSTDYVKMRRTIYTAHTYLYTGGFVACLFLMYTNTSAFLQQAGDPPSCHPYISTLRLHFNNPNPIYQPYSYISTTLSLYLILYTTTISVL